jgi:hypothetical protein
MNNTHHTPAPWQVSPYGNITSKSLVVAKVEQMPSKIPGDYESEKQANARLIAAAPEMLQALERAVSIIEELPYPQNYAAVYFLEIIQKAKGEA